LPETPKRLISIPPSGTAQRWASRILLGILLIGVALRAREFLSFRSLWLDEIALLLQIKRASYEQLLLSGLKGNQGAPAAYLVLSRWLLTTIPSLEVAVRLLPFITGIGFLFASRSLSRLVFSDLASRIVFLLLCSTSPVLIYYSAEGKHYMQEALVASLLLLAFLKYQKDEISTAAMAAYGAAAIWCAHCAPVILCAGGLVHLAQRLRGKRFRECIQTSTAASLWAVSFALHASTNLSGLLGNTALRLYWGHGLAPWRKGLSVVAAWAYDSWSNFLLYALVPSQLEASLTSGPLGWSAALSPLLLAVSIAGLAILFRGRAPVAPYITATFLVAFGLSLFRIAPFSSRLILYLVPFIFVCCSAAIGACLRGSLLKSGVGLLLLLIVAGPSLASSTRQFVHPLDPYDMKRALQALSETHQPGEPIILRRPDYQAFVIYSRRMGLRKLQLAERAWRLTPHRSMRDRLVTVILKSPTKSAWVIGAFRSAQVAQGLSALEQECCQISNTTTGPGFITARVTLRADYHPSARLLQHAKK
jgi:hypothetical protein